MLRVASVAAKAGLRDQAEMESLVSYLKGKGYLPVIRSMFTGMFASAGLPGPDEQLVTKVIAQASAYPLRRRRGFSDIFGELFLGDDPVVCTIIPLETERLQASIIECREEEQTLQKFCTDIEEGIRARFDGRRVRGMEFDWKKLPRSHFSRHPRHRDASFEGFYEDVPEPEMAELKSTKPDYSSKDIEAAKLLVDADIRQFCFKLAQVGKMRSKDAAELVKLDIVQRLFPLGLVAEEYLLTCKQDQHTICVVPSRGHLNREPTVSLRCSVCGRSFADENLQVIYAVTERGKKLLDGSLWMSIWITELLAENGVKRESIKWRLEASGEELDIMVEDFDSRIFFELKDREFGLGDAYPFVYRVTRYGGTVALVATLDKVATDAKKFFEEEAQRREPVAQIRYLEGSGGIREGIAKLVGDMSLRQVRRLVQPFSGSLGFDLWPIVEQWINIKMTEVSKNMVAARVDDTV